MRQMTVERHYTGESGSRILPLTLPTSKAGGFSVR